MKYVVRVVVAVAAFGLGVLASHAYSDLFARAELGQGIVDYAPCCLAREPLSPPSDQDEALDVYKAAMGDRYQPGAMLIHERTSHSGLLADSLANIDDESDIQESTRRSYQENNKKGWSLKEIFGNEPNVAFFTEEDSKRFFHYGIDGWSKIYKSYPTRHKIESLSAVGFNNDHTQALVNVGYMCAGLCGAGNMYILEKRNGKWLVTKTLLGWVS